MTPTKDTEIRNLKAANRAHVRDSVNHRRQIRAIEHDIYKMVKENPGNTELIKAWNNIRDYMKEVNLHDQRVITKQYETING